MINIIYILRNKINHEVYIGQTWQSLEDRWNYGHGYHGCIKIDRAIIKYGKDNFYYEILITCISQEEADYWETYYIEKFDSVNNGYNICSSGNGCMTGRKHTEESKKKMSQNRKGKLSGENNPFYGKHHTEETKKILSEKLSGSQTWLGKTHTEESKKKISQAGLGRKHSEETKQKISQNSNWSPNSATKIDFQIAELIRIDHSNGMTGVEIANKYNLSRASISRIITNKAWTK